MCTNYSPGSQRYHKLKTFYGGPKLNKQSKAMQGNDTYPLPKHHRALATFHSRHRERAPVTFKKPSEERKKGGKRKEKKTGRPLTGNSQATTH